MTVVMLTPLFPPDTSESAAYVKLLATQLRDLPLTVLAYGKLPESVEGVEIISIDKSGLKINTVARCLYALYLEKPTRLIAHNGPSSDLPTLLYAMTHPSMKLLYIVSDIDAANRATGRAQRLIIKQLKSRAIGVISLPANSSQYVPAEEMPFSKPDIKRIDTQNKWWEKHIQLVNSYVS